MARPRQFEDRQALEAAMLCFWQHGFEATSVRDLAGRMGLTSASLYNAFGDKRTLFARALDHYIETSFDERSARLERTLPPRAAIEAFYAEMIERSLQDAERKGCMLVNSALDVAPHDAEFRLVVAKVMKNIEAFFFRLVEAGQGDGSISRHLPATDLARHLLSVQLGLRVLARVRPERDLLEGLVRPALVLLDGPGTDGAR